METVLGLGIAGYLIYLMLKKKSAGGSSGSGNSSGTDGGYVRNAAHLDKVIYQWALSDGSRAEEIISLTQANASLADTATWKIDDDLHYGKDYIVGGHEIGYILTFTAKDKKHWIAAYYIYD